MGAIMIARMVAVTAMEAIAHHRGRSDCTGETGISPIVLLLVPLALHLSVRASRDMDGI